MKYVVLQFDSDDEANEIVQWLLAQEQDQQVVHSFPAKATVMGVFKGPTVFCDCKGSKGRIQAWTKGQKYGWWVCKACKKPSRAVGGPIHQMRMVVGQGNNLLDEIVEEPLEGDKPAEVWDEGWGALGRGR